MKLVITAGNPTVGVGFTAIQLISVGIAGPRGPTGPGGATTVVIASEALGGHRVVTADGYHCVPAQAARAAGITKSAAIIGDEAGIVTRGPMTELSWNWTSGQPVYIGASGVLTQVAPTTGLIRQVGFAVSATILNVDFLSPILQT